MVGTCEPLQRGWDPWEERLGLAWRRALPTPDVWLRSVPWKARGLGPGHSMSCRLSGLLSWHSTQGTTHPSQHPGLGVQLAHSGRHSSDLASDTPVTSVLLRKDREQDQESGCPLAALTSPLSRPADNSLYKAPS